MNSLVRTGLYLQAEDFPTFVESLSPFSIVDSLVLNKRVFVVEGFPEVVTLLIIFPTVNSHLTLSAAVWLLLL